jgi:hypothetical protein
MGKNYAYSNETELASEICDVWGLKNVKMLDIHLEAGYVSTVSVKFNIEEEDMQKGTEILKKFRLLEMKKEETKLLEWEQ